MYSSPCQQPVPAGWAHCASHLTLSPCRSVRLLLYGFGALSATVGFLISIPQLAGALMQTTNSLVVDDVVRNIGIDLGAAGACGFLFNRDWKVRHWRCSWVASSACTPTIAGHMWCTPTTAGRVQHLP
jgi:hypothetical protein